MASPALPSPSRTSRGRHPSSSRASSVLLGALVALVALGGCDDDGDDDPTAPGPVFVAEDPANDIRAAYTASARNADLDVRRASVTYDGTNYVFTSTSAGAIGTTANALFVWGVDRGQGIARFGDIATGVHFDVVVVARADGTGQVTDLTANPPATTALPAGSVVVTGNDVRITVPAALLPTKGFSADRYTANLWPRVGMGSNNTQIADFAPDNSNINVRSTR